jgi:hypothetical protein
MKSYRVGHSYRDLTKRVPQDEFINWFDTDGSTIGTTGGIRSKKYLSKKLQSELGSTSIPSFLILTTTDISQQYHNPWEDSVDYNAGQIIYWGDAKFDEKRRERKHHNFRGNMILSQIHELILLQKRHLVPPILHFSRKKKGWVVFNGLCVLDRLETAWFEDKGRPIVNYRCHLSILDADEVPLSWVHQRAVAEDLKSLDVGCPPAWRSYVNGQTNKLYAWMGKLRGAEEQLPKTGSFDSAVLKQIADLSPVNFEKFCRKLLEEVATHTGIQHQVRGTRHVRDGGFDFFGRFIFPEPLRYEIQFKGEAKKYSRTNGVGPKEVSRLVARLQRGEYGIFITTSYYTLDAQKEVGEDDYPVRLFSGIDLVNFLRVLGKISSEKKISPDWLARIIKED